MEDGGQCKTMPHIAQYWLLGGFLFLASDVSLGEGGIEANFYL